MTGAGRVGRTIALATGRSRRRYRGSLPEFACRSRSFGGPNRPARAAGQRAFRRESGKRRGDRADGRRGAERVRPHRHTGQLRLGLLSQADRRTHRARLGRQSRHEPQGAVFSVEVRGRRDAPQGAGKIVNIGDWAGIRPYNNYLPYTVSKSGLIGLTRALAKALAPEVQVNCVALGPVMPPEDYDAAEIERCARHADQDAWARRKKSPRGVLFFCESTDFATGSTLMLDGGRLLN